MITVAADGRGEGAQMSMGAALGYVGVKVLAQVRTQVPVTGSPVGVHGLLADPGVRDRVSDRLRAIEPQVLSADG